VGTLAKKRTRVGDPAESYGYIDYYKLEEKFKSALAEKLDVALSTRASESTLAAIKAALASVGTDKLRASIVDALPESPFNLSKVAGTALTSRDWSGDFAKLQNLDISLSSLKAVGVETPRTLSNIYDAILGTQPRNLTQISGTALTGRDWSGDFAKLQNLDLALSALKDALTSKLTPILKGSIFNTSVTANTNVFSSDLSPTNSPTTFRIYACFDTGGVLTVRRTKAGVTVGEQLNGGTALTVNAAYIFDIMVESGETINLQYSVNATALKLAVYEVPSVIS
jgi:hypothetical protein